MNGAGGEEKQLFALFSRDAGAPTISAPIVRRGRGSVVNGGVVRRAARGAVRRLNVIRANDGGRALRGTMRGAAGFCRSEWLIGLPGGCEGGSVGRRKRRGEKESLSANWPGRRGASLCRAAAPMPGAADGKAAAGRPPGGLLGNGGRSGGRVGLLGEAA